METQLYRLFFYRTKKGTGGWRWRLTSVKNGKIIGASSEAYKNAPMCVKNFTLLTGVSFPERFRAKEDVTLTVALFRDGGKFADVA